jgi:protein-disulfide isomerase
MIRRLAFALAAAAAFLAAPAQAFEISEMTADERAVFRDEVRAYLLDNPEVLMEAIAVLEQRQAAAQVANDAALIAANAEALFNDGYSHVTGNPEGDITIVEFVDYRCGYCRKAHPEVLELLEIDGNIRLILKEFPILGEESMLSSRFAIATQMVAGEEAYGRMHDALITLRANATPDTLVALANDMGLDGNAILEAAQAPAVDAMIGANHALAGRLQINGTPGFVIGDQLLRGYLPLEGMQQVVAEARQAAGN